jgi:superfamily I DNA/RNA helicase
MAWNDGLVGLPLEIAQTTNTPLRVMAGPGTGKSYAMMRRLMRCLEEGVPGKRIFVVTFTRTAAADLVKEIGKLGTDGCADIRAGTLHSYCFAVLAKQHVLDITGRVPRPLVTFSDRGILQYEASPLLEDLSRVGSFGDMRERTRRIRAYEAAWARLQSDEPGLPKNQVDEEFRRELVKWLKFHRCMLVGELVPLALGYLRYNVSCPERTEFDYILVDEYQDLNKAEQVLIDQLAEGRHFAIFGDEDQSIYSFRWANPEGIREFHASHPGTADCNLNECRRCPKRVVAMADSLIRHNHPPACPPRLSPKADKADGEVFVVQWPHMGDQSDGIAQFVRHLIDKRGYKAGDVLVLSPRRRIGYEIRDAMLSASIPTHSFYHEEALDDDRAKLAYALLTLHADRADRVALRYLLGEGSNTWNARGYAVLRDHCDSTGATPWEAMEGLAAGKLSLPHTSPLIEKFSELVARLNELTSLSVKGVVQVLFPPDAVCVSELRQLALEREDKDVASLCERLRRGITQPELPEVGEYARVMSLHKSKGLTSRVVIVAGCMHGLIPNVRMEGTPDDQEAYEHEQRRLFYVAITRCTDILLLSSVSQMDRKLAYNMGVQVFNGPGQFTATLTSTFLGELGLTSRALTGTDFMQSYST